MSIVRVTGYAKVNLTLEVLGKRPDGYHEIRSVMQSISLADELVMEQAGELSLECDVPALEGDDNLVVRAARALQGATHRRLGARILLRKGIPAAAGLGGASADAAATLIGLMHLWELELPASEVAAIAASLGSDVPFFLSGGTALASGRGERIDPLPDASPAWLLLLVPAHSLAAKTAELYGRLGPGLWSSGDRTERLAAAIRRGRPLEGQLLGNVFEGVADAAFPGLVTYREAMRRAGALEGHISGAGPTLFSLFNAETDARAVAERLSKSGHRPLVARTLSVAEARPSPRSQGMGPGGQGSGAYGFPSPPAPSPNRHGPQIE